jgi:hypothetical protein
MTDVTRRTPKQLPPRPEEQLVYRGKFLRHPDAFDLWDRCLEGNTKTPSSLIREVRVVEMDGKKLA